MSFFDDLATMVQQQPTATVTPQEVRDASGRVMVAANEIGGGIAAGGQIMSAINHAQFGETAQAADNYQAQQLRINAGQSQATSQIQAYGADLQGKYAMSAALAHAAAGGGGASDPTVVNLIARNAGVTAYQKAVALYGGDERARLENMQADAKEFEGANMNANSQMVAKGNAFSAVSTLMDTYAKNASLYQRFGRGVLPQSAIGGN